MRKLFSKIIQSEDRTDDLLSLLFSGLPSRGKTLISRKVKRRISGTLNVEKRFQFGFLTNRIGLDPAARGVLRIYDDGVLNIHGHVRVARSCKIFVAGICEIGNGTYLNPATMIFARTRVSIGANCAISWNCEIIDDDFHNLTNSNETAQPIVIEDNVWIGSHCSILKGVTIGEGAVIGSRSVVTKNIPPRSLAVGIPAKVIKTNIDWS